MKLPLLDVPGDAPAPRLNLSYTRGVPSERALAVNTGALPERLPFPTLDPNAGTEPLEALARLGATIGQVPAQLLDPVLAAEAKKRDAQDLAEATSLYTQTALKLDEELERLKTSTDHNTLRPAFDAAWRRLASEALQQAPNKTVQDHLALKLASLRISKSAEVSDVVRRKFVNYHEATLTENSKALVKMATDPDANPLDRDFALANLESLYRGYAASGIFPADTLVRLREAHLTTAYNTLAHQAMSRDPLGFMPKSIDPEGRDGYKQFTAQGKYPADPKYLDSLIAQAPKLIEHANNQKRLAQERTEKRFDEAMKAAHTQKFDQLFLDLTSGDPERERVASESVEQAIRDSGLYWSDDRKRALRTLSQDVHRRGGTTNDAVYNDLLARMYANPYSVSEDELNKELYRGTLATSGDRSYTALMEKLRQLRKSDDISQRSDYQIGRSLITSAIGGSGITDSFAAVVSLLKPADVARHRYIVSKALEEYDTRARSPEWQGKNLRDLGAEVRDKYAELLYQSLPQITPPPQAPKATPPADRDRSSQEPAPKKPQTGGFHWLLPNWFQAPGG